MMHSIPRMVQMVAVFGTVSSSIYYLVCLWSAAKFLRERKAGGEACTPDLPPISILKPLKGTDPEIDESFRSHCLQDYPQYELIFGVSDPDDPAIESVKELQRKFPGRRIQLVVSPKILGANVKVSTLAQMLAEARYDYLIVNDSDIRVQPDYLRRVTAPLADLRVGMVTCLYRGVAGATLGSRLEALGISTDFCASVLAARQLEGGIRFGLGSSLAFRRAELEKIGGFASFVDYLADDYELGRRMAGLGLKVELSDVVVETYLPAYSLGEFFAHQLRWARGVRDARRGLHGFGFHVWVPVGLAGPGGESRRVLGLHCAGRHAVCSSRGCIGCGPGCSGRPPDPEGCLAHSAAGFADGRNLDCEPRRSHRNLAGRAIPVARWQAHSDPAVAPQGRSIAPVANCGTVSRL